MSLLGHRLEQSRAAKVLQTNRAPGVQSEIKSDNDNIALKLERALKTAALHELEEIPRQTVLRMLMETKLDEIFTFKVSLGTGAKYVQAMRMVLSRARQSAKSQKKALSDFKLFEHSIVSEADHDVVKLIRSIKHTELEENVYSEITRLFEKQPLNKK